MNVAAPPLTTAISDGCKVIVVVGCMVNVAVFVVISVHAPSTIQWYEPLSAGFELSITKVELSVPENVEPEG